MRPFGYSVSVNFRVTSGAYWKNVKKAILRAWPIGTPSRSPFASLFLFFPRARRLTAERAACAARQGFWCGRYSSRRSRTSEPPRRWRSPSSSRRSTSPCAACSRVKESCSRATEKATQGLTTSPVSARIVCAVCVVCVLNTTDTAEHGSTVQTNIDHWSEDPDEDIMWSIQRRAIARKTLQSLQRKSAPITEEVRPIDLLLSVPSRRSGEEGSG